MQTHFCTLNIHYTAPQTTWQALATIYPEMPYWQGYINQCATWYGMDDQKLIQLSVEPSGLAFFATLPEEEWLDWIELFKQKATKKLGYAVGEPEEGFEFQEDDSPSS